MSQFKVAVAAQYPTDSFATITVVSTVGYVVGEAVYQGASLAASTGSAKVSAIIDATKLRVKGVKGTFAATIATIGNKSSTSSLSAGSGQFFWGFDRTRTVGGAGTAVRRFGEMSVDDSGFIRTTSAGGVVETSVSARMAISKMQNTDASVAPTFIYTIPTAGTYITGSVMRFTIKSNESLGVVGAPRVAIVTNLSAQTVYAAYDSKKSTPYLMVFEYVTDEVTTSAGQIVSAAYEANGAVVTDIGGGPIVPNFAAVVTGILIA